MKILVVEDETLLAQAMVTALEWEFDKPVELAVDGQSALDFTNQQDYDLAILDWSIPPPTGIELIALWRQTGSVRHILMLSAWDREDTRRQALAAGADIFLTKPLSLIDLRARARELVSGESD